MIVKRRIASLIAVLATAMLFVAPSVANAGILTSLTGQLLGGLQYPVDDLLDQVLTGRTALDAKGCPDVDTSRAYDFAGDLSYYFMAPSGDFEDGAPRWGLAGATIVKPNASTQIGSDSDSRSLKISDGGGATSQKFCVGYDEPTFRLFTKGAKGDFLQVTALFTGTSGEVRSQYVGLIAGTGRWTAGTPIPLDVNYRAAYGQKTAIALVFHAVGGDFNIDNLYIDPYRKG